MPCQIDDIPFIDLVLISHTHYDHMSHPTILKIKEKNPEVQFFAPLGTKDWFNKCGIENVTELDWWDSRDVSLSASLDKADSKVDVSEEGSQRDSSKISATVGCLPCQHMGGRTPFDRGHALWSSWSVESGGQSVYFAGE